ncbi:MAG: SLC13 family permease [Pseudomonadales bacterium]|jgi:di/tricarboxylate transporter|nr:SLC13 family permease [Pseudomonadales bacterium]
MNQDLLIVLALLGAAIVMFVRNRPAMDVVAVIMMTTLPLTGIISVEEALAGFSDPNIVLIAALFIVGDSLVRTGVTHRLGDWLLRCAGSSEGRLASLLMSITAGVGSVMSSTAATALFIPVVLRITRRTGIAPHRLLMVLSMGALISGMMTLIATAPNLVVNSALMRQGFEGFHFFSFTPFGVTILLLGILYMRLARRALTCDLPMTASARQPHLQDWVEEYALAGREYRLRIGKASPLIGRTLGSLGLRTMGFNIIAIERPGLLTTEIIHPVAATQLHAGDSVLIDRFVTTLNIGEIQQRFALEPLPLTGSYFLDQSQAIGMVEALVPPDSPLIDKTVLTSRFRSEHDLTVLGLRRATQPLTEGILDKPLHVSDTLLLIGPWRAIRRLQNDRTQLVVLKEPAELQDAAPAATRAPYALLILAAIVSVMASGIMPNVSAALVGCLLLGFWRCTDATSAYRSIHWQTLVLIVGMMPFAVALQKTGGIDLMATGVIHALGGFGVHALLAGLFVITAVVGLFISNTATTILMAPVALAVASDVNASPYPFAMIVALAASAAFMTPVSSPVNALVVAPGNYQFADFVRIGVPFTVIVMLASVALVPWLLPP